MNRLVIFGAAILFFFAACGNKSDNRPSLRNGSNNNVQTQNQTTMEGMTTTGSGLKYKIHTQGTGEQAKAGDVVSVHYTGTLKSNGQKFDSSLDRGEPIEFPLGKGRVIPGWDEGIALLRVGDKATLDIPANLAYGAMARPKIPANSDLIFEVELVGIKPAPEPPKPYNTEGVKEQTTDSGLKYFILNPKPDAMQPKKGQVVAAHYTLWLEDGQKLDSSVDRGQPLSFQLGSGQVIPGWDEGVALMHVGEKARLVVPPSLGYGSAGSGPVPGNATLYFDIELVAIQ